MSTAVVTWSCSSKATSLRLRVEILGQLLLDPHPIDDHGRTPEVISDALLHADLIIVQRDGDGEV